MDIDLLRRKLEKRAKLNIVAENRNYVLVTAPSDDDLEELLMYILKEAKRPLGWAEIKEIFRGYAGEERIRKVLIKLKVENKVAELTRTRYSLPEYVPPKEYNKVKNPLILEKIRKLSQSFG